ncbi:MAG: protein-L-isoaspartate(D-aspartate) O-methyltransferase [Candidatus Bathyarchaeia archaeon]
MGVKMANSNWETLVNNLIKEGILRSPKVIKAMQKVPRNLFLPENMQPYSAQDTPLPIGFGQTVSAPHMVSIMNEALELEVGQNVLEVGAGSGWHAATIAEIIAPHDAPRSSWGHVYTVEIVHGLAEFARKTILKAGYGDRVTIVSADGSLGYAEKAPYDRILVTAAAPSVPSPLIEQLKPGGIMLIPIGDISLFQSLMKITKTENGKIRQENLGGVAFVPLTGQYGHKF